jgi:thiamine-monophosphate kinase
LAESRARLSRRGEHAFLDSLCERLRGRAALTAPAAGVLVGPGDDAAVVGPGSAPLAITTDALVEGVHFRTGWLAPEELGARAIAVNLSDLAAMGASPRWTLVAAIVPPDLSTAELDRILDACAAASEDAGAAMIGGNLSRGDALSLTVTAVGALEGRALERRGARAGDRLVVTGTLGAAAAAVDVWLDGGEPPPALRERFARPVARLAAGRALARAGARAAIDVSDGLLADLGHLCRASGVGAVVERARLPRLAQVAIRDGAGSEFAAAGGEDYELLAALPADFDERAIADLADACEVELTIVGRCTEAAGGVHLLGEDGCDVAPRLGGFDHFATESRRRGRQRP